MKPSEQYSNQILFSKWRDHTVLHILEILPARQSYSKGGGLGKKVCSNQDLKWLHSQNKLIYKKGGICEEVTNGKDNWGDWDSKMLKLKLSHTGAS